MNIRSNVRRRRRRRIEQLLSGLPAGEEAARGGRYAENETEPAGGESPPWGMDTTPTSGESTPRSTYTASISGESRPKSMRTALISGESSAGSAYTEPDPEKWWKAQQKMSRQQGPYGKGASYQSRVWPNQQMPDRYEPGGRWSRFWAGFALRLVFAAAIFSAAWVWFRSDLPGSGEAKAWAMQAVTQDMDFQAAQAWYEQTFGGSPSFLPMFRSQLEAREVFGGWKRSDAILPVQGRVVQSYGQDGTGVRIAAPGDSRVKAVYGGRVMQVETDAGGKSTVLIQHAGKIVTIYGNLLYPEVRAGDWVEAGDVLGSVPPPQDAGGESLLYFAVRQNGKTVDPAEVVPFD